MTTSANWAWSIKRAIEDLINTAQKFTKVLIARHNLYLCVFLMLRLYRNVPFAINRDVPFLGRTLSSWDVKINGDITIHESKRIKENRGHAKTR